MEITLPNGTASAEAVLKTSYRLAPVAKVRLLEQGDYGFKVSVEVGDEFDETQTVSDFHEHITDYYLREVISNKTEGVRNLLLAQAFSKVVDTHNDELTTDEKR